MPAVHHGGIGADGDMMLWTKSFMSHRRVGLVIDGHQPAEKTVNTGDSYWSPVLPIVFVIYLSGVIKEVMKEVEGCLAISFAGDYGWLVVAYSVEQLCERLARAGIKAVEWGERNHISSDNSKDKMMSFTR